MCAVTIYAQAIENRYTHCGQKVSIRGPAHLRFAQFIVEQTSDSAGEFIKFNYSFSPLHRRAIDAPGYFQAYPFVIGPEGEQSLFDFFPLRRGGKPNVYFSGRCGRHYIRPCSAMDHTNVYANAVAGVVKFSGSAESVSPAPELRWLLSPAPDPRVRPDLRSSTRKYLCLYARSWRGHRRLVARGPGLSGPFPFSRFLQQRPA